MTLDEQVAKKVAKEVMKKLDIEKLAAQVAPKLADAVAKEIVTTVQRNWEFNDLIYNSIDNNKVLQKILGEKIAKVFA